ncbi:MAG: RNA pseudouridine synthase [Sneathiella sp.]|nr:MAG: RNA pseudouridine synthase [Sneathiella sp.]
MIDYAPPMDPYTDILFEDAHLLVINKPSGLLSVPGRPAGFEDCVAARYQSLYADARIVHRLDLSTSGVMVLARGDHMTGAMGKIFQSRNVSKSYLAWVAGEMVAEEGSVDLPLIKDWPNRPRQKVCFESGKPSLTHWRRLRFMDGVTEVELTPVTGRSHQLRVHMAEIGHPILGDPLYAPPEIVAMAERLQLHATTLAFTHPVTGDDLSFTVPSPLSGYQGRSSLVAQGSASTGQTGRATLS